VGHHKECYFITWLVLIQCYLWGIVILLQVLCGVSYDNINMWDSETEYGGDWTTKLGQGILMF